jgi:hypothetical protein
MLPRALNPSPNSHYSVNKASNITFLDQVATTYSQGQKDQFSLDDELGMYLCVDVEEDRI